MNDVGYDSPERAAMEGFPPKYCHVVAARVDGDHACVLLDTGSPGQPYLYEVHCRRRNGRWFDDGSSNGSGWHQIGDDHELGTLTVWGDAPESASAVRCPEEEWPRRLTILTSSGWNAYDELELWYRLLRGETL